jgi:hypothetical protein
MSAVFENEIIPDPARQAYELRQLKLRVEKIEMALQQGTRLTWPQTP